MKHAKTNAKCIIVVLFFITSAIWAQSTGDTLYVSSKNVDVKASSGFFGRINGTLSKGDAVTVEQNRGKWLLIRSATGLQGWAASDAFSSRQIINSGYGPSLTEFALAGKGFNDTLEKFIYSPDDPDFSKVDAMENFSIEREELRAFLNEGHLAAGE